MSLHPSTVTTIKWQSIKLTVRHVPNWGAGFDHIEITSEGRVPFPISETGYRSHFLPAEALHPYGDARSYVEAWLDEAADTKWWKDLVSETAQLTLF